MTRTNGTGANTIQRGGGARNSRSTSRLLMVLGVMAVAGGVSGCFFGGSDGPDPVPFDCASARVVFFDWSIVKHANGAPLTCGQANAASIVLDLGGMQADFACPFNAFSGREVSSPVLPGTYLTFLQLLDPSGRVLSDTTVPQGPSDPGGPMPLTIPQCASVNLGLVPFGAP